MRNLQTQDNKSDQNAQLHLKEFSLRTQSADPLFFKAVTNIKTIKYLSS